MSKQTFTVGQVLTAAQMTSLQQTAMGGGSTTAKTASYVLVAADAGTVVQMNAAGATTITVNTALFAAGDSVQIQNIGAGVCTVTAGTATVSTSATLALKQYDAGSLYFNTTSAAIFFAVDAADGMANPLTTTGDMVYSSSGTTAARLGIGSSAQVLTVASGLPAWATPAVAASGMTLITRSTFSAVTTTTTTFDGCFTSTYESYLVVAEKFFGSDANADTQFQLRYAGPITQATGYYGSTTEFGTAATFTDQSNTNQFTMMLYPGTTSQPSPFNFFITMVGNGSRNPAWNGGAMNGGINRPYFFGGSQLGAAREYTGLLFLAAAGTISGTIAVYGLAKA